MVQFSRTVDVTLDDGETERFVVQTLGDDAVKIELSGTSSPYDIDIQTSSEHPDPESQFDSSNYSSSLPMGSETYEDTDSHVTATQIVSESVYVKVENDSGSQAQFSGIIETHSSDSPQSALGFITERDQSRPISFRDGRQILRAADLSTAQLNGDYRAAPGELQDILNNEVSDGDKVILHSGAEYDTGSETTVPQNVTLVGNGAVFRPSSDYNVLFVDSGAHVKDIEIDFQHLNTYTSNCILISGAKSSDTYAAQDGTEVYVSGKITGNIGTNHDKSGTAIRVESDGVEVFGNDFDLNIREVKTGLRIDTSGGGFVTGRMGRFYVTDSEKAFHFSGNNAASPIIRGIVEPSGNSTHAILTEGSTGMNFIGHIWDTSFFSENAIEGSSISVFDPFDGEGLANHTDGADDQVIATPAGNHFSIISKAGTDGLNLREYDSGNSVKANIGVKDLGGGTPSLRLMPGGKTAALSIVEDSYTVVREKMRGGFGDEPVFFQPGIGIERNAYKNPTTAELSDGQYVIGISDGSDDVVGSAGDVIIWRNNGGTIESATLVSGSDYSAV